MGTFEAFAITISILLACVIATMMLILFVQNGNLAKQVKELKRQNASLRHQNKQLRDEMSRRPHRLAAKLPRRGW